MPRPEKVRAVEEIKERFEGASAIFLTEYRGLSVAEQQELRRNLRDAETDYKVVKMSLARRAVNDLGIDEVIELLAGPTALAFTEADPVPAAKALQDFAKDHGALLIKGGLLRGRLLPSEKITELAELEPREVLLAKTAGAFQAPMARLAGLMQALTRNTATVLSQLLEKKEGEEPEEPAAEESETAAEAEEAEAAGVPEEPEEAEAEVPGEVDDEEEAGVEEAAEASADEAGDTAEEMEAEEAEDEEEPVGASASQVEADEEEEEAAEADDDEEKKEE